MGSSAEIVAEGKAAGNRGSITLPAAVGILLAMLATLLCPVTAFAKWDGGHDVIGCTGASRTWYFAEGCTRAGFSEWICLMNPGDSAASASLEYMLGSGETMQKSYTLAPGSRTTVDVGADVGFGQDVSVRIKSSSPIIAERPMYFNYKGAWTGGHDVMGAQAPAETYYFAEGTCRPGFDPYICVQNPSSKAAKVRITYMLGNGARKETELTVGKHSRSTVTVKEALGEADDSAHDFSAKVETTNGTSIIAERPMYFAYLPMVEWTLSAAGDVNLGGDVVPILLSNGFAYPWSLVSDLLRSTTLTFANLECAISNRGEPVPGKAFTFRGPPDGLAPMRDAGVDVVSQANNHARDFGGLALTDSLGYLDAYSIAHCGAGADFASAHAPAFLNANGLRVAFLAYNDIGYDGWPGWQGGPGYPGIADAANTGQIAADIAAAESQSDLVVASFHWGTERKYTPDQRQRDLACLAVDSGADLVLGHHPHVIQGFEFYQGRLIAYSMGNFVFSPGSEEGHYTILTQFEMDSNGFRSAKIYPVYISSGRPQVMGGAEATSLLSRLAGLSAELGTQMTVSNGVATIP